MLKEDLAIEAATSALENQRLDSPLRSATRRLVNLPSEIIDEILDSCEHKDPFKGEITRDHYPTNDDWPLLKTLRLVNKALNKLATPRLFEKLTLYQHEGHWKHLDNIANDPILAQYVEHIKIAHIAYIRQVGSFNEWEFLTERRRGPAGDLVRNPPAGGPLADWGFDSAAGWERYQRWRDAELAMRNHEDAKTAPKVALERLVNLKSVETTGLRPLLTIERKPWTQPGIIGKGRPETLRYFATGFRSPDYSHLPTISTHLCTAPSTHLHTMMIALRTCGKDLSRLVLHRVQELWNVTDLGLPSLKHLVIDTSEVKDHAVGGVAAHEVSSWILHLENLDTVVIKQNPKAANNPDLCEFFRRAEWPGLRRLELITMNTSLASLSGFVSGRVDKLDRLSVSEPLMSPEDWTDFKTEAAHWSRRYEGRRFFLSEDVYPVATGIALM